MSESKQENDTFPLTGSLKSDYNSIDMHGGEAASTHLSDERSDQISVEHRTTVWQTFVHLIKGYMGAGCLSLPWAVSQLGLFWGPLAIFVIAYWSSYNCWTIVKLKRFIEEETSYVDDKASETSSVTANTNITYPDVGKWAYGTKFQTYVSTCVCTQQLAICTVFISFVGENLLAVMESLDITFMATHAGVMTIALPIILALSMIPNLKMLAPVMTAGTLLLIASFIAIGVVIQKEWPNRPDELPTINPSQIPLAVCAILYSYEGINLILPVESAMFDPQEFKKPFVIAMTMVAMILVSFSVICVVTFGYVNSGSVTAFLLEAYPEDHDITWWLMVANTAVSLSVLLTYPLQLFPVVELLGPYMSRYLSCGKKDGIVDDNDDDDLSAFEPLPPLPEHDIPDWEDSMPMMEHQYNATTEKEAETEEVEAGSITHSGVTSVQTLFPEMTLAGDSIQLRVFLVFMTYLVAVVVPNVQSLISLAGALAGSSSALLIPPLLELAWIRHIEVDICIDEEKEEESSPWSIFLPGTGRFELGKWWFDKLKCYALLTLGLLFFFIGTFAALADIVRIYLGGS
jgi:amino acid permease